MRLLKDLRVGASLTINDVVITLEHKSGQLARLAITAPADTRISTGGRGTDEKPTRTLAIPEVQL